MIGCATRCCSLGDDVAELARVPMDDGGCDEVRARQAVVLSFRGTVADLAATAERYGTLEGVVGLALADAQPGAALKAGVRDPAQQEQQSLDPADLLQGEGEFVLSRVGGQLAQDGGGLDGASAMETARRRRSGQLRSMRSVRMRAAIRGRTAAGAAFGSKA